jgi:hypothetical protein
MDAAGGVMSLLSHYNDYYRKPPQSARYVHLVFSHGSAGKDDVQTRATRQYPMGPLEGADSMIRPKTGILCALAALAFTSLIPLTGCEQGPAEKAGENIDKGVQNVKDAVNPPGPAEKVGRAIDKGR